MRHHRHNASFEFVREPEQFNKYTEKELLQYCVGATIYMPGTKDISNKILNKEIPEMTSMVFCFEDACPENEVTNAEKNVLRILDLLADKIACGELSYDDIPLIFCRIRNYDQFKHFSNKLTQEQIGILAGFNFPKFDSQNALQYLEYLCDLNVKYGEIIYGMPIIESVTVAYKESRIDELMKIRRILDRYREYILQVRVGATDFSSCFGVRRGVDYSIYDILTVREILSDIVNIFGRNNDYVISGPVWEYFRASKKMMFQSLPQHSIDDCLLKRTPIVNTEIDGLLREVILDKANGFVGRTVIHPTHIRYVNVLQATTEEEYRDAKAILANNTGGVFKGENGNKMNEVGPHMNWATKIAMKARAYGVIKDEGSYLKLFSS